MGSQPTTAGRTLEAARIRAGLTRTDAAAIVTRDPLSVARWERGECRPPRAVLERLSVAYRVPLAELVDL